MEALSPKEVARVAEIEDALASLRIGGPSSIDGVLPAVQALLDTENAFVYSLADSAKGWTFEHWHHSGNGWLIQRPFARLVTSVDHAGVFYDPRCPDPAIRNRVMEATAWIDREVPETWARSQMCRDVFVPIGMQRHQHLRVLLCDGVELLCWFGTITAGPIARRQSRLLAALAPAMRRRLLVERRLAASSRLARTLDVVLEAIGAPAFVITSRGVICETNASARKLLETRRREIVAAIADVRAGRPTRIPIELTPITARGTPAAYLAIVREPTKDVRLVGTLEAAAIRWSLTPRQRQVLERIVRGDANVTIATHLKVSVRAVEWHVTALFDRVGVDNRAALVAALLAL